MILGNKYQLNDIIMSNFNKEVYGKKGDVVTLISLSDQVAIVEDLKAIRFSMNIKFLTEIKKEKEKETAKKQEDAQVILPLEPKEIKIKKPLRSKTKHINQSLF